MYENGSTNETFLIKYLYALKHRIRHFYLGKALGFETMITLSDTKYGFELKVIIYS